MKLINIADATAELQKYVPQVASYSGDNMTLDRMWPLLEMIGNPQEKLKVIHIAGTSGKTSTSYYISSYLASSGKRVGLTVSPHIDSVTERIQINGLPIDDNTFCTELGIFLDLIVNLEPTPSYFELLVAFMYWEFDRQGVDYAVVETGMGGLLDGTNVALMADKVCVITDIGFDHMHILGSTLPEIAIQKAGIIQSQNEVFMYRQANEITEKFIERSRDKSAKLNLYIYDELLADVNHSFNDLPDFQKRNWLLSKQVCKFIANRDKFELYKGYNPNTLVIPARMETITLDNESVVIMDGAHNGQKMQAFVSSFKAKYPEQKALIMLALKKGKEYRQVIDAIEPIADLIILTTFSTSQDLPAVSQNPVKIRDYCETKGIDSVVLKDHKEATEFFIKHNSDIKIITGSFYLIGQIREYLHDVL